MSKYLFDKHQFDGDDADPAKDTWSPPQVYSEKEYQTAKSNAYEQGRKSGLKEALGKEEAIAVQLLSDIKMQFETLFAAETAREKLYEDEALKLSLALFDQLFPDLEESLGPDILAQEIKDTLQAVKADNAVLVSVHPENVKRVENLLKDTVTTPYEVQADGTCGPAETRLSWKDGGAIRDRSAAADMLKQKLFALIE